VKLIRSNCQRNVLRSRPGNSHASVVNLLGGEVRFTSQPKGATLNSAKSVDIADLPACFDWYNYWTNERLHGGQTITADAPIDVLPLFVRAGSILPLGSEVLSTQQPQAIDSIRVYAGADGTFTLFQDDGKSYAYENGGGSITKLAWDNSAHRLKHEGAPAWSVPDQSIVTVIGE
jgi:alpha-glucosidase (family GH31 glycosyl hydrolase)